MASAINSIKSLAFVNMIIETLKGNIRYKYHKIYFINIKIIKKTMYFCYNK